MSIPIFESNIGQCTDEGLVEEILVNGSKLKFILSHLTSIFLHNVVSCFIYLGSAEVRRVIIFKIPGLFSDEALTFNLPIYKNALLTYNLSAKTSSWFQQIKNIGGNSFTNQRYDAFDRLNNFDTRSAIGKNSINNSVGGITSRESLLAAISIVLAFSSKFLEKYLVHYHQQRSLRLYIFGTLPGIIDTY